MEKHKQGGLNPLIRGFPVRLFLLEETVDSFEEKRPMEILGHNLVESEVRRVGMMARHACFRELYRKLPGKRLEQEFGLLFVVMLLEFWEYKFEVLILLALVHEIKKSSARITQ